MGIDGFNEFVKKKSPNSILILDLINLSGKYMSIDMLGLIFKMNYIAIKSTNNIINFQTGEVNYPEINQKCTELVLNRLILLMNHNINLILCFDYKPHKLRQKVMLRRS